MFDLIDDLDLAGVSGGQQLDPIQPQLPVDLPSPKGPNGPNPGPCFPRPPWPETPQNPKQPLPLPIPTTPDPVR